MKIRLNRILIFLGLMLQQCWQRKPDAEKWLYLSDDPAREYAGRVLGPDRGTGLMPPEPLSGMEVDVHAEEGYAVFSSGNVCGMRWVDAAHGVLAGRGASRSEGRACPRLGAGGQRLVPAPARTLKRPAGSPILVLFDAVITPSTRADDEGNQSPFPVPSWLSGPTGQTDFRFDERC